MSSLPSNSELDTAPAGPTGMGMLLLGALGVVFGDIGTSPIYAFRVTLAAAGADVSSSQDVLGLLSLIIWALIIVVTGKYVGFVLRADNKGEGGTLALMALARDSAPHRARWVVVLGVLGASMFFGDAVITPAISVLSAVEGLKIAAPALDVLIVPITVFILSLLFFVQSGGTEGISRVFGPITALWFVAIAGFGLMHLVQAPQVLAALSPVHGVAFVLSHGPVATAIIGGVFLAVTGAEALYSDLGHFGFKPIVRAWFFVVFPSLLLNYFGQGAYVLSHQDNPGNIFYQMLPDWARLPMLILATAATVIASQAVITGAFSLARQAVQLNLLPRLEVRHTSATQLGQIFMPQINYIVLAVVLLLVVGFGSSDALASAYGISVTGEMLVSGILLFLVIKGQWKWPLAAALAVVIPFAFVDLTFLVANLTKIVSGGWVALVVAMSVATVMLTWMKGRRLLTGRASDAALSLSQLIKSLERKPRQIVPGAAVFFTTDTDMAPQALLHSLKHFHVLHEQNLVVTLATVDMPRVPNAEKVQFSQLSDNFWRAELRFGFMESPNVPRALLLLRKDGWAPDPMATSYFLSRRSLKPRFTKGPRFWRSMLFIALSRNATDATSYFELPANRVVEIGAQMTV